MKKRGQKLIPIMTRLGNLLAADDAPARPLSAAEMMLCTQMASGYRLEAAYASVVNAYGKDALPSCEELARSPRLANAVYDAFNLRLMLSGVPAAIRCLENILADNRVDLKIRLAAANSVLDRAGIGATAAVEAIETRAAPTEARAAQEALEAALIELGRRAPAAADAPVSRDALRRFL